MESDLLAFKSELEQCISILPRQNLVPASEIESKLKKMLSELNYALTKTKDLSYFLSRFKEKYEDDVDFDNLVEEFIKEIEQVDPSMLYGFWSYLLSFAAEIPKKVSIVKMFHEHGMDLFTKPETGGRGGIFVEYCWLLYPDPKSAAEIIQYFLDNGADPNIDKGAPLIAALSRNYCSDVVIKLLVTAGANVSSDPTLISLLCGQSNATIELIELFISKGAKLENEFHPSGSLVSARFAPLPVSRYLLENGIPITEEAISKAVCDDKMDILHLYVEYGADPDEIVTKIFRSFYSVCSFFFMKKDINKVNGQNYLYIIFDKMKEFSPDYRQIIDKFLDRMINTYTEIELTNN